MIPRIREVHLRNYRSIQRAVVPLSGLTVLVGPNGSGKTNFLDALAFVQECLSTSIDAALHARGGMSVHYGMLPQSQWNPHGVGFRLVMELEPHVVADYAFQLVWGDNARAEVAVEMERCVISINGRETHRFEVKNGTFVTPIPGLRVLLQADRLALYAASAVEEFRPVYDFLIGMRIYSIQPERMREAREISSGLILEPDGANSAGVLRHLQQHFPEQSDRVHGLLQALVPGIKSVRSTPLGGMEMLMFTEQGSIPSSFLPLFPANVSDGTLRMLGLVLAVYQPNTPTVLLIEEPEATIHPAAVDVVMSVLLDAAKRSQVLVTTHSPDVLDYGSLPDGAIRVVAKTDRGTSITPVANASREAIRQRLYSPGELLRSDELNPDIAAAESLSREQDLFGDPVHTFSEA
ncbi:MAG TPA: AAA family ATPase [Longimicrobium sp.]|nr:AAA family ATPase [Longimicrobium sp.]